MHQEYLSLNRILDQTLDCIFIFEKESLRFIYVNNGAVNQLGYSKTELMQMTPVDIKPDFSTDEFRIMLEPLIDGSESKLLFQTVHRNKSGINIPVEIFLQYIPLDSEHTNFVAIVRDISDRQRIENALKQSEENFRALTTHAPVGIFKTDDNGGCIFVNKRWSEIAGLTIEEARGSGWTKLLHPDDKEKVTEHWQILVEKDIEFSMEYRFQRADESISWVTGQAIALHDAENNKIGYIGTIIDISGRKRLEEQREQMDRKLLETQKLESLGILAGGIAHDFNNLLTGIMGNASLASLELAAGSPVQEQLSRINEGTLRAADLCKQLLAYSGKGRFIIKNLNLNQIVEETLHLLEISISKKAVLSTELFQALPAIEADPTQIRQILMNLVINASEAIGDSSGVINITTGLTRVDTEYLSSTIRADELPVGTYAYLDVSDTGCGMSNEVLSKIFDPFFTTKFTGRGLGLAAAMGISRGHNGTIKVYSEINKGTTFKLLFPIVEGDIEKAVPKPVKQTPAMGMGCILIVDDEETIRSTVAAMATKLGFSIELAADGRQAVEMFAERSSQYALVLMDLTMPHLNGDQAFAELRKINSDVPVILMSGFNQERAISKFKGKGLAGFIEKPFTYSLLSEVLSKTLQ